MIPKFIPPLGVTGKLTQTFKLPRGYFPIKYRLSGFDYKDLTNFTSFSDSYFQKPFSQEFIDFVVLNGFGSTDTLKTYYGITVTADGNVIPNGLGTGFSVNAPILGAMNVWLKAKYGGELVNFDMPLRLLVRDLMEEANKNYSYPTNDIVVAIKATMEKLKEFALIAKSDPMRIKSIKFSDVGGNSRKQYEENMIYFQTDGDTEIKQIIKPSLSRSSRDKNTEIVTIIPTKPMVLDGLRDLDVSVIGDERFSELILEERAKVEKRIKYFLDKTGPLLFFDATAIGIPVPDSLLILPFTLPDPLNTENGVDITLIFEKVRQDFVVKPIARMLTPTFVPMPVVASIQVNEQVKINTFDTFDEDTEIAPKNNVFAIVVVVLVLLVGIVLVGES